MSLDGVLGGAGVSFFSSTILTSFGLVVADDVPKAVYGLAPA